MRSTVAAMHEEVKSGFNFLRQQYATMRVWAKKRNKGTRNAHFQESYLSVDAKHQISQNERTEKQGYQQLLHRSDSARQQLYHSPDRYYNRPGGQKRP
jgi:hypothetical protein